MTVTVSANQNKPRPRSASRRDPKVFFGIFFWKDLLQKKMFFGAVVQVKDHPVSPFKPQTTNYLGRVNFLTAVPQVATKRNCSSLAIHKNCGAHTHLACFLRVWNRFFRSFDLRGSVQPSGVSVWSPLLRQNQRNAEKKSKPVFSALTQRKATYKKNTHKLDRM